MPIPSKCMRKVHPGILLATVALLMSIGLALETSNPKMSISTTRLETSGEESNRNQYNRRLRTTTANDDYDSEDRGAPGAAKVEELVKKSNLQKLGESIKSVVNPSKQEKVTKHFKTLKVDQPEKSKMFSSRLFHEWIRYARKKYKNDWLEADAAMFKSMAEYYGDDVLARILADAKHSSGSWIVTRLEKIQLSKWKDIGKDADEVYKILRLDAEGEKLLQSPALGTWVNYVSKLGKNPIDELQVKLSAQKYDDAVVAKMIALSRYDVNSDFAADLGRSLQKKWKDSDNTESGVFHLLKLDDEKTGLLTNPVLEFWMRYVDSLGKDPYKLLLLAINRKGINDAGLARMVGLAQKDRNNYWIGTNFESRVLDKWKQDGKSGNKLFTMLELDKEGDKVFDSPVWKIWTSYLNKNEQEPNKIIYSVLRDRFDDSKLATLVSSSKEAENTVLNLWKTDGKTINQVFNLLKLDKTGDEIFERSAFSIWMAYVHKLNPDGLDAFTLLEKRYGSKKLAAMLSRSLRGKHSADTKQLFSKLQELQFKKWMGENNNNPTAVHSKAESIGIAVAIDFQSYRIRPHHPYYMDVF
ncbi:hypothetical protein L914_14859 [Phytophthora nicotianae]|uniref:RxLR effector protein n=1 Tax=Phytophthora nicotianae TaxID=4792 RepID=W2MRG0_PHYNI|nr:hypothetical protein L914_14859 [Phytophthora nicotianae]